jgi:hypothetical protein
MLGHEQPAEAQAISAAQMRITPQELAEAVAAVELHQDPAAQNGDTIAIGDAVQQLELHVTPEELWKEVQRKRNQAQTTVKSPRGRRFRLMPIVLLASLAANLWLGASLLNRSPATTAATNSTSTAIVGDVVIPEKFFGRARLKLSEAIQHRIPLYVTLDDLRQIAKSPEKIGGWQKEFPIVQEYGTREIWRLFPLEDGLYVRGWHAKSDAIVLSSGRKIPLAKNNLFSEQVVADEEQISVPIRKLVNIYNPAYDLPGERHLDSGVVSFPGEIEGINLPDR